MGSINFGNTAEDYRRYRAGFPIEFFTQPRRMAWGWPDNRYLILERAPAPWRAGLPNAARR